MNPGSEPAALRRAARGLATLAVRLSPPSHTEWARALRHEIDAIDADRAAALFALGGLRFAVSAAIVDRCRSIGAVTRLANHHPKDMTMPPDDRLRDPVLWAGVVSAVAAVALGVAYMLMAQAPSRLIAVNLAALSIGVGGCFALVTLTKSDSRPLSWVAAALGGALLMTALFGVQADGAARWINLGGVVIQPSLIVIPFLLVLAAQRRDRWTTSGVVLAVIAVALQPDRAMAGVLAGTLSAIAVSRRDRRDIGLAVLAVVGFLVTMARPDFGGVSPFVDRIFFTAYDVSIAAGLAVSLSAPLLLLPALVRARRPSVLGPAVAFGTAWSLIVLAALVGNYPTPLAGYGGSAILGYLLSVALLAKARPQPMAITGSMVGVERSSIQRPRADRLGLLVDPR